MAEPQMLDAADTLQRLVYTPEFNELKEQDRFRVIDNLVNNELLAGADFDGATPSEEQSARWREVASARGMARMFSKHSPEEVISAWDTINKTKPTDISGYPEIFRDNMNEFMSMASISAPQTLHLNLSPGSKGDITDRPTTSPSAAHIRVAEGDEDIVSVNMLPHPTRLIASIRPPEGKEFLHEFKSRDEVPQTGKDWLGFFANEHADKFNADQGFIMSNFRTMGLSGRKAFQEFVRTGNNLRLAIGVEAEANVELFRMFSDPNANNFALTHTLSEDGRVRPLPPEKLAQYMEEGEQMRKDAIRARFKGIKDPGDNPDKLGFSTNQKTDDGIPPIGSVETYAAIAHVNDLNRAEPIRTTGRWATALNSDKQPIGKRFVPDNVPEMVGAREGDDISRGAIMEILMSETAPDTTLFREEVFAQHQLTESELNDAVGKNASDAVWAARDSILQKGRNVTVDAFGMTGQTAPAILAAAGGAPWASVAMAGVNAYSGHFAETFGSVYQDQVKVGKGIDEALLTATDAAQKASRNATPVDMLGDLALAKAFKPVAKAMENLKPATKKGLARRLSTIMANGAGETTLRQKSGVVLKATVSQMVSEAAGELTRAQIEDQFKTNKSGFGENLQGALYEGMLAAISTAGNASVSASAQRLLYEFNETRHQKNLATSAKDWEQFRQLGKTERLDAMAAEKADREKKMSGKDMDLSGEKKLPNRRGDTGAKPVAAPDAHVDEERPVEEGPSLPTVGRAFRLEATESEAELLDGTGVAMGDYVRLEEGGPLQRVSDVAPGQNGGVTITMQARDGSVTEVAPEALGTAEVVLRNADMPANPQEPTAAEPDVTPEVTPPIQEEPVATSAGAPVSEGAGGGTFNVDSAPIVPGSSNALDFQSNLSFGLGVAENRGISLTSNPISMRSALDESNASSNPMVRAAAEALGDGVLNNVPVFVGEFGDKGRGFYTATTKPEPGLAKHEAIFVNDNSTLTPARYKAVVGHEAVHATVRRAIDLAESGDVVAAEALEELKQAADNLADGVEGFDLTDVSVPTDVVLAIGQIKNATGNTRTHEFLAHALTNDHFQEFLRNRDVNGNPLPKSAQGDSRSIIRKIADWITKILTRGKINPAERRNIKNAVDHAFGLADKLFTHMKKRAIAGRTYASEPNAHRAAMLLGLDGHDYTVHNSDGEFFLSPRRHTTTHLSPASISRLTEEMLASIDETSGLQDIPTGEVWTGYAPGERSFTTSLTEFSAEDVILAALYLDDDHKRKMRAIIEDGIQVFINGAQRRGIFRVMMKEKWGDALDWFQVYEKMHELADGIQGKREVSGSDMAWQKGRGKPGYRALLSGRAQGKGYTGEGSVRAFESVWLDEDGVEHKAKTMSPKATTALMPFLQSLVTEARGAKLGKNDRFAFDMFGPLGNLGLVTYDGSPEASGQRYSINEEVRDNLIRGSKDNKRFMRTLQALPGSVARLNARENAVGSAMAQAKNMWIDETVAMGLTHGEASAAWRSAMRGEPVAATLRTNEKNARDQMPGMVRDYKKVINTLSRLQPSRAHSFRQSREAAILNFERIASEDGHRAIDFALGLNDNHDVIIPAFPTDLTGPQQELRLTHVEDRLPYYIDALSGPGDAFEMLKRVFEPKSNGLPATGGFTSAELQGNFNTNEVYYRKFAQGLRDGLFAAAMDGRLATSALLPLLSGQTLDAAQAGRHTSLVGKRLNNAITLEVLKALHGVSKDFGGHIDTRSVGLVSKALRDANSAITDKSAENMPDLISDHVKMWEIDEKFVPSSNAKDFGAHFNVKWLHEMSAATHDVPFISWAGLYAKYVRARNSGGMLTSLNNMEDIGDKRDARNPVRPEGDTANDKDFRRDFRELQTRVLWELSGREFDRSVIFGTTAIFEAASSRAPIDKTLDDRLQTALRDLAFKEAEATIHDDLNSMSRIIADETGLDQQNLASQLETAGAEVVRVKQFLGAMDTQDALGSQTAVKFLAESMPDFPVVVFDGRNVEASLYGEGGPFSQDGVTVFGGDSPVLVVDITKATKELVSGDKTYARAVATAMGKAYSSLVTGFKHAENTATSLGSLGAKLNAFAANGFEEFVDSNPAIAGAYASLARYVQDTYGGLLESMEPGVLATNILTDARLRLALHMVSPEFAQGYVTTASAQQTIDAIILGDIKQMQRLTGADALIHPDSGAILVGDEATEVGVLINPDEDLDNLGRASSFGSLSFVEHQDAVPPNDTFSKESSAFANEAIWLAMKFVRQAALAQYRQEPGKQFHHDNQTTRSGVREGSKLTVKAGVEEARRGRAIKKAATEQDRKDVEEMSPPGMDTMMHTGLAQLGEIEQEQRQASGQLPLFDDALLDDLDIDTDAELETLEMAGQSGSLSNNAFFTDVRNLPPVPNKRIAAKIMARQIWNSDLIPARTRDDIESNPSAMRFIGSTVMVWLEDVAFDLMNETRPESYRDGVRRRARAFAFRRPTHQTGAGQLDWKHLFDVWRGIKSFDVALDFNSHTKGGLNVLGEKGVLKGQMKNLMANDDLIKKMGAKSRTVTDKLLDLQLLMEYGVDGKQGFVGFRAEMETEMERLDELSADMRGEEFSELQVIGILGSRVRGTSALDTLEGHWKDIKKGHENVRARLGHGGLDQRYKEFFPAHERTINMLSPLIDSAIDGMKSIDKPGDEDSADAHEAYHRVQEAIYDDLQGKLWGYLNDKQANFVTEYRKFFREKRAAKEIVSAMLGDPMGVIDNYWPMDSRRSGNEAVDVLDTEWRDPSGKVGASKPQSMNKRDAGRSDYEYLANLDGFSAMRRAVTETLFTLNTTQGNMLLHDIIGTQEITEDAGTPGAILRMLAGDIKDRKGRALGVTGTRGEYAGTHAAMTTMRQIFDRTRSGFQQKGVIDNKMRRFIHGMAQFGAFHALAGGEQLFKQTIPGVAVYVKRMATSPKKMGMFMRAMAGMAQGDPAMLDMMRRAVPSVYERGVDGVASLNEKFSKELLTKFDAGDVGAWMDMEQLGTGIKNGRKHALGALQGYYRKMLHVTTGMPDGMLSRAIWFTEYATLEAERTGAPFEAIFADAGAFNAKSALKAQTAMEEIMAQSEQTRRGSWLQSSPDNLTEMFHMTMRAFGNHSISMWSNAQAQWSRLRHGDRSVRVDAAGKLFEITLQNAVFRTLTKAVRDLLIANLVGTLLGKDDSEKEELYHELLESGFLGQLGIDVNLPGVGNIGLSRAPQPIESWADWRSKYGWRALMDNTMILPPGVAGGLFTIPVGNDLITPGVTQVMENFVLDSGLHKSFGDDISDITDLFGYVGVAAGNTYNYAKKEKGIEGANVGERAARAAGFLVMTRGMRGRMLQNMSSNKRDGAKKRGVWYYDP